MRTHGPKLNTKRRRRWEMRLEQNEPPYELSFYCPKILNNNLLLELTRVIENSVYYIPPLVRCCVVMLSITIIGAYIRKSIVKSKTKITLVVGFRLS